MKSISADEYTFDTLVIQSNVPVLVDFWAPWCGPCLILAPMLEEIAQQYEGRVKVVKVNTDQNPRLAARYQIMSIPTLILFRNGEIQETMIGAQAKQTLVNRLDYYLNAN